MAYSIWRLLGSGASSGGHVRSAISHMQNWSGKRDSNPRPRAWKARALPTELFPHDGGEGRIRTYEALRRQIYSLLPLATREPLHRYSKNAVRETSRKNFF